MLQCVCIEELNMKRTNKYIILLLLILGIAVQAPAFSAPAVLETKPAAEVQTKTAPAVVVPANAMQVTPLALVANPNSFLNKTVVMTAKFDKFSTVGLDYPPALRKTEDYIGLMVFRDDTEYEIPLSELKLFMKREDAQKFIELKSKDSVKIVGKVFSSALGDPWVDVLSLESIKK